ncbi:hypothetical protein F5888DRAFT_1597386, partial [Russula emetica]
HPNSLAPSNNSFDRSIHIFHSATVWFYAPSDFCSTDEMYQEIIQANPDYGGVPCFDTVFVTAGPLVAHIHLLFSYIDPYNQEEVPCMLITWF